MPLGMLFQKEIDSDAISQVVGAYIELGVENGEDKSTLINDLKKWTSELNESMVDAVIKIQGEKKLEKEYMGQEWFTVNELVDAFNVKKHKVRGVIKAGKLKVHKTEGKRDTKIHWKDWNQFYSGDDSHMVH